MKFACSITLFLASIIFSSCKENKKPAATENTQSSLSEPDQPLPVKTLDNSEKISESKLQLESKTDFSTTQENIDKVIAASEKVEHQGSTIDAKMAKVLRLYALEVQADLTTLAEAAKKLEKASKYVNIKDKENIAEMKKLAAEYIEANAELKRRTEQEWLKIVTDNMAKENFSPSETEDYLAKFRTQFDKQLPYMMTIRTADETIAKGIIEHLDIFETHWGNWKWDLLSMTPMFKSREVLSIYNEVANKIDRAVREQAQAQKELEKLKK